MALPEIERAVEKGRLKADGTVMLEKSNLANYDGLLILRLAPAAGAIEQAKAQYEAVMGDTPYDSTNPNLPPLQLQVEEMIVYLERSPS